MLRQAVIADLDSIEEGYREHFAHERAHGAYTVFREGIYPTRETAETALQSGSLYIYIYTRKTALFWEVLFSIINSPTNIGR